MFTINPKQLQLTNNDIAPDFTIYGVSVAIQRSKYEFDNAIDLLDPNHVYWFCVTINFAYNRRDGGVDYDTVITDGERYYLINNSMVASRRKKKRIEFNRAAKELIDAAIVKFLS